MRREDVPQSDDLAYRDYLIEVEETFTKTTPTEFETPLSDKQIRQQTLQKLKKSFKQDFGTRDNTVIGANKVPIEVLKAVLIEDLGFIASNIPQQGSLSDRQHLDNLIALSTQTTDALSTTYRIDLTRSDLEKTTRVRENILTLQSHLRDDKFEKTGYNPFFLYKDEWRLRFRTPFFPENHYALKQGLFATPADRSRAQGLIAAAEKHKEHSKVGRPGDFVARLKILMNLDRNLTDGHRQFTAEQYGLARDHYKKAVNDVRRLISQMTMMVYAIPPDGTSMEEVRWTPDLSSAESFCADLDPATHKGLKGTNKHLFGSKPPWQPKSLKDQKWHPWTDAAGGKHPGNWKTGLEKKKWHPVDKRTWDPAKMNIPKKKIFNLYPYTATVFDRLKWRYSQRAKMKVNSIKNLNKLETRNTATVSLPPPKPLKSYANYQGFLASASYKELERALFNLHDDLVSLIPHVMFLMLPICQGDVAAAVGDFSTAANHYAQAALEHVLRASLKKDSPFGPSEAAGDLPWTWTTDVSAGLNGKDYPYLNKDCEVPFLLLRLGALYLTWADQLYRSDQEPEVYRARELYKAVLRQYGIDPLPGAGLTPLPMKMVHRPTTIYESMKTGMIQPGPQLVPTPTPKPNPGPAEAPASRAAYAASRLKRLAARRRASSAQVAKEVSKMSPAAKAAWSPLIAAKVSPEAFAQPDVDFAAPFISGAFIIAKVFLPVNPAILAQQTRARIGITQIDAGLNYYGYTHDLVPILRYRPLATAAQHFTTLAKHAETDFLGYKERAEKAELALIHARNAAATTAIRVQIESQRIIQAEDHVQQAKIQLQQVKDTIKAKKAEIDDHNSLCGQVKDFFSGIKEFFGIVPEKATSYIKSDFSAAFGFETAAAGTTAGLGVVGGMALFAVSATVTMSGMADSANKRVSELKKLQTQQLPMAMAALDARKRELAIAQLQKAVATLDALTAQEVLRYSLLRTLNAELWTHMAAAMKSALHRYLDLGAMTGWLAERALSYAQDKDIRLIRFDYFQPKRHGLLAADELQTDIASLEKEYITGMQQTVPIKWTVSLARDFPLQFGQLKAKGRCAFITTATPLNLAHPGSYSHRIRAVEVTAILPVTEPPPRGLLTNPGISHVEGAKIGDTHTSVRPPDVLPLSEFTLKDDMAVYQLPGETLMPFEGSGIDTLWILEFPAAANPAGLAALADICITFNLQARFSPSRKTDLAKAGPPTLTRTALFSAKQLFPESLKKFVTGGDQDTLEFTITQRLLPTTEKERKVTNVAVFFLGKDLPEVTATLASDDVPSGAKLTTDGGLAHSNHVPPPASIPTPAAALDPLATGTPEQKWILTIAAADNPNLDRKAISNVILGIEYTAKPKFAGQ